MGRARASVRVEAPAAEVWGFYFDRSRWRGWVDGFGDVARMDEHYPQAGSKLRWDSKPRGRGRVLEQVLVHDPRSLHRIRFEDGSALGTMETRFEPLEREATEVTIELDYALKDAGPLGPLTDLFFIRRAMAASAARSLNRLKRDVEGDRALLR